MRNAFAKQVEILAEKDPRVVLLMGDIGNRMFNQFQERFPNRFFNAGIAEANMITMAAGMASEGLRPYCYTIAPFVTSRAYEQIKLDLGYHHLPVVLIGTGAGLSYASLGATHHSLEDVGIMRTIPGMQILSPGDSLELESLLDLSLNFTNPSYIRIGKKGEPTIHSEKPDLELGRNCLIQDGSDLCIFSTGNMLPVSIQAANHLASTGHSVRVESVPSLVPFDHASIHSAIKQFKILATIEEHGKVGGLGDIVASIYAETENPSSRIIRFDAGEEFIHLTCNQDEARNHLGLNPENISSTLDKILSNS